MINGELTTLNSQSLSFKPFEGGEAGGTYEGEKNTLYAMAATLLGLGYSVSYDFNQSPIGKLTFRSTFQSTNGGAPTNPNVDYKDTWELIRTSVHKEILESDHPVALLLNDVNLKELQKAFANPAKSIDVQFTLVTDLSKDVSSANAAVYFWEMFQNGVKTVEVKQPKLRLTRTTSHLYTAPFYTGNIDKVMTTATMKLDSGVPNNFAIPLVDLANSLKRGTTVGLPDTVVRGILISNYGWLKELIGCHKHGNQRIQYILEYTYGLWDDRLYGEPI